MSDEGHYSIATAGQRQDFVNLWGEFLREARKGGSSLHADDYNLKVFRDYFDAYATGELRGLTIFWRPTQDDPPAAILLGGEVYGDPVWHDDHTGTATMWGIYVLPEHRKLGLGVKMCEMAIPVLRDLGFSGACTTVRVDNPLGMAMRETLEKLAMIHPLWMGYVGYWDAEGEL